MKNQSAFVGQPANTLADKYLIDAIFGGDVPPIKAPPGYVYQTRGPGLAAGTSVAIFLVIAITSLRIGIRAFHKRMKIGADDFFIVPAALASIAYLITILVRVGDAGAGKHLWDVRYVEAAKIFEVGNIGQPLFFAGVSLTKISITLFNRRLTGISSKKWQIVHISFLVILTAYFFISLFINIFTCAPVKYRYNYTLRGIDPKGYTCLNVGKINYALNIFHALTDFMLLTVPIIILSKVSLPLGTKIRLCLIFSFGSVSCIASAMRIVISFYDTVDFTWSFAATIPWTIIDSANSVIVASLPTLNVIIDKYWPKEWSILSSGFLSRRTGFNSGNTSGGSGSSGSKSANTGSVNEKSVDSSRKPGIVRHDEYEVGYRNADDNSQKDQLPYGQIPDSLRNSQNGDRQGAGKKDGVTTEVKSVGSDSV